MPLKTETNTKAIESRIHEAAQDVLALSPDNIQTDFEHGQWWVTCITTGAQWSVVDATGGRSVDGFDFEQVTEGTEA